MDITKKVRLYPNKTMSMILDNLCDYRRYCWNQALEVWLSLVQQRQKYLPADLRLKVKQAIKDKSITFTDDENALLIQYPAPTHYTVRKMLTADKQDWQHQLSSRALYLAVDDLAKAWTYYLTIKTPPLYVPVNHRLKRKNDQNKGLKLIEAKLKMVN